MNNSAIIEKFCALFDTCENIYAYNYEQVGEMDKLVCDIEHDIELGKHNASELLKLARKLRDAKRTRRRHKDVVEELRPVVAFLDDPQNKRVIDRMHQLLGDMRKVEAYHEKRFYTPRVKEET